MPTALIIDDEPEVRMFLSTILSEERWQVAEAESAGKALELAGERLWDLVFCDVRLGDGDGFAVLRHFKSEQPDAAVVIMTGHGSAAGALDATAMGAYDYLLKPFGINDVLAVAERVRASSARPKEKEASRAAGVKLNSPRSDINLIGRSAPFVEVMKMVGKVALTKLPVMVTGESGTGKELIARAIHSRSKRAEKPFVAVNCGALVADLIDSELFGHVRGAFTGADRERAGLFEEADGGTIFLDEVTETSANFQVKLLRVLQQGEIRRVGSNRVIRIDVRVITATNRDPQEEVAAGRFRQDLLYRLNAVSIHLPALRERGEDIPDLVAYFAAATRDAGVPLPDFTPEAMRLLRDYPWPGNIRELENVVERAVALSETVIQPADLPQVIRGHGVAAAAAPSPAEEVGEPAGYIFDRGLTLAQLEGLYVMYVLRQTKGNKQAASRVLDVDYKTLLRMIKRHNITAEKAQPEPSPGS